MDSPQHSQWPRGSTYQEPQTPRPPPQGKQRKNTRIGNALRKLLGRKSIKSQISLPTPTATPSASPFGADPIVHLRDQRAVSLPARHITRQSALGSNAPFVATVKEEEDSGDGAAPWRPPRPPRSRRASMPGTASPSLDLNAMALMPATGRQAKEADTDDIGYAVTSGSHPNRRSKSAGALHDLANGAADQPSPPDESRRRSYEIRILRNSLAIGPSIYAEPEETSTQREFLLQPPRSAFSVSDNGEFEILEDDQGYPTILEETNKYRSYDFNAIAATINEQEVIPLEDRLMVMEIKLMDLENAIAKARSSSPSANTATPRAGDMKMATTEAATLQTPEKKAAKPSPTYSKSDARTASTASAVSTQPTTSSLGSNVLSTQEADPFVDSKDRPTSRETALRLRLSERLSAMSQTEDAGKSKQPRPLSLTSITIDHYTTLISLIRREQHARIRLENQVADLQRELFHFMHPPPAQSSSPLSTSNSAGSLYRARRWDGSRKDMVKIDDFHPSKRRKSYEGEPGAAAGPSEDDDGRATLASTDDGYPDVFETPTDQRRPELGGRAWGHGEGEAF